MNKLPKFYLASQSPRRHELLKRVGIPFVIVKRAEVDESVESSVNPAFFAEKLAINKVKAASIPSNANGFILGFDTIVYIEDEILGKPENKEQAFLFLKRLSGSWHSVFTGVAVMRTEDRKIESDVEITKVKFSKMTLSEIELYVNSGESLDKAGAYGIQELGALLVERIEGCFYNVMGLPLLRLTKVLERFNIKRTILLRRNL